MTVGGGKVWITDANNGLPWGIAEDLGARESIPVGDRPLGVAYSGGTVWVANYGSGTVSRVDPPD
jgi:DNA-binding beta-propeller fold protein YncE